jgi:hypothetical protein
MPNPKGAGFAVIELFTSEGCSSCPPADAALARIAERAARDALPIFPVELHVDYWDYLGWQDPFDDARFSARQAGYRGLSGQSYTPQAVVNGAFECVGSNASRLSGLIERALATPATTELTLSAEFVPDGVRVRYQSDSGDSGQRLALLLLEARSESVVTRGENAGERLAHRNVARAFGDLALASGHTAGSWHTALPPSFQRVGARVLAFSERSGQHGITGASLTAIAAQPPASELEQSK